MIRNYIWHHRRICQKWNKILYVDVFLSISAIYIWNIKMISYRYMEVFPLWSTTLEANVYKNESIWLSVIHWLDSAKCLQFIQRIIQVIASKLIYDESLCTEFVQIRTKIKSRSCNTIMFGANNVEVWWSMYKYLFSHGEVYETRQSSACVKWTICWEKGSYCEGEFNSLEIQPNHI